MRRMAVLMAVAFVDMIGLMLVLPLLPLYATHLHASATTIGFLTAAFPVAQLLASPVWGRVSDRYGRRPALLVGLTASTLAYVVFGLAGSLWLLFVSRFVQGLGGGTTGVAQAYVADTMAPHERAKALGWLSAATSLGVVIGPVVGSFAARAGQSAPGLVAAALCLCNVAFAWKWLPESRGLPSQPPGARGRHVPPPEPRPVLHAMWDVIRHPGRPAAQLIWIYAVAMLAYNSAPAVFTLYLSWRFGIDVTNIGWFFTVFGGVGVLMRAFVVGPINDRLGEVRTMRVGAALYALGYAAGYPGAARGSGAGDGVTLASCLFSCHAPNPDRPRWIDRAGAARRAPPAPGRRDHRRSAAPRLPRPLSPAAEERAGDAPEAGCGLHRGVPRPCDHRDRTGPRHDSVGPLARAHRHHSQPGRGAGLGHAAHRRHRDRSVPGAVPGDGAVRLAQGGRADGAGAVGVGEGPRGHPADRPRERAGLLVRRRRVHDQPLLRRLAAPVGAGVQRRAGPVPRGGDAVEPGPPRAGR